MFAAQALHESIAMYINLRVRIIILIRAYNIDDLYHTGWRDAPDMVKIVYVVCVCIVASSQGPTSSFINVACCKAGGPGTRNHGRDVLRRENSIACGRHV